MKKISPSTDAAPRETSLFSDLPAPLEMAASGPGVRPQKRRGHRRKSKSETADLEWNIRRPSGLLEAFRELIDLTTPALAALPVERRLDARCP